MYLKIINDGGEIIDVVSLLIQKGVKIVNPQTVTIDSSIDPDKISEGVIIHSGCSLMGSNTSIGKGSELGFEGPVIINNCNLGRNVKLKGGYFEEAVFFDNVEVGYPSKIRPGTIMEEYSNASRGVGLKQTILFPFVTLGSNIDFCDIFMAGGTSKDEFSEVGSGFIHFNFTPHGDKATASLIGDVPLGVMLDQNKIFLGGQGGIAGPIQVAFGTTTIAGSIIRKDILKPNQLVSQQAPSDFEIEYARDIYKKPRALLEKNLRYLANIIALKCWYLEIRKKLVQRGVIVEDVYNGGLKNLETIINERIKWLEFIYLKLPKSLELINSAENIKVQDKVNILKDTQLFIDIWPELKEKLVKYDYYNSNPPERLVSEINSAAGGADYIQIIKSLSEGSKRVGSAWLEAIVEQVMVLLEE